MKLRRKEDYEIRRNYIRKLRRMSNKVDPSGHQYSTDDQNDQQISEDDSDTIDDEPILRNISCDRVAYMEDDPIANEE